MTRSGWRLSSPDPKRAFYAQPKKDSLYLDAGCLFGLWPHFDLTLHFGEVADDVIAERTRGCR